MDASEDFEFTQSEVDNLKTAMKDKEFRNLLSDYVQEMTDPENRKLYEAEITQLEAERGVNVTFLHPEPCYVVKTSVDGEKKAFINICRNANVNKPTCNRSEEGDGNVHDDQRRPGFRWSIPYSLSPPREDVDKEKRWSMVYDVLFHPDTIYMATRNAHFKKMIEDTALDGIESNFQVKLDRKNVRYPKLKFKGMPVATVVRKSTSETTASSKTVTENGFKVPYPDPKDSWIHKMKDKNKKTNQTEDSESTGSVKPKHVLKYRNHMDIQDYSFGPSGQVVNMNAVVPKELVVEVDLPLIKAASNVDLDVTETALKLSSTSPAAYELSLKLPHAVDADNAKAKFDTTARKLTIVLPVKAFTRGTYGYDAAAGDGGDIKCTSPRDERGDRKAEEHVHVDDAKIQLDDDQQHRQQPFVDELYDGGDKCDDTEAVSRTTQSKPIDGIKRVIDYSLPSYDLRQTDDCIVVLLKERNINPESVVQTFEDDHRIYKLVFHSLGSGFVPFHFSLSLRCPEGKCFSERQYMSCSVEGENAVMQLTKGGGSSEWDEVLVGVDAGSDMETKRLVTKDNLLRQVLMLKDDTEMKQQREVESGLTKCQEVLVTNHSAEIVEIEIQSDEFSSSVRPDSDEDKNGEEEEIKLEESSPDISPPPPVKHENGSANMEVMSDSALTPQRPLVPRHKFRSLSECSEYPSPSRWPKGILKFRRFCRSFSECSDDISFSSQEQIATPDTEDIPEESSADEMGSQTKKSVRFNEVVSRNLYRTNSSILGQRKKNQRKQRNKKRAAQRRTSESETSEAEASTGDERPSTSSPDDDDDDGETTKDPLFVYESRRNVNNNAVGEEQKTLSLQETETTPDDNVNSSGTTDKNANSENNFVKVATRKNNDNNNKTKFSGRDDNANHNLMAQDGTSTSGDEGGTEWQVVKESRRKKRRPVKSSCGDRETALSWDDKNATKEHQRHHHHDGTTTAIEFRNSVMYELDD